MKAVLIAILNEMTTRLSIRKAQDGGPVVPSIIVRTDQPGTDFTLYLN